MGGMRWTHKEIAILVENRHDLDRVAELLGRTKEACRKELERLGLSKIGHSEKFLVVFPQPQIDRRKEVIRQSLPRLKTLLMKIVKQREDLTPENMKDLAKIVRAMAALFNAVEKWETGKELLEMLRGGKAADSEESSG